MKPSGRIRRSGAVGARGITIKLSRAVLFFAVAVASAAPGVAPRAEEPSSGFLSRPSSATLSPRLADRIARSGPSDTLLVWIFLRDRGSGEEPGGRPAALSAHAALRLAARGSTGRDDTFRPVEAAYVDRLRPHLLRLRHCSRYFNAVSAEARAGDIADCASLPFVRQIDLVRVGRRPVDDVEPSGARPGATPPEPPSVYGESLGQLEQIGASALLDEGLNGSGNRGGWGPVRIAILDTGFRLDHVALRGVDVEAQWDFINGDSVTSNQPADPPNQDYHGTIVLGVIAGHDPYRHAGPAWGARYLLAKTEISNTEIIIEEDHWVAGIEWADSAGAEVVSSSVGYFDWYTRDQLDGNTALSTRAADIAAGHGIVVVNSAGNRGAAGLVAPADGDSVIAAGAVDAEGTVTYFSSRGPTADGRIKPDFVARGLDARSVAYGDTFSYALYSGTSFAAPLIAGMCAQLLDARPSWSPVSLRDALRATASKGGFPDNGYGWGIPNAVLALSFPGEFAAGGAFPNPFTTSTRLQVVSPRRAPVTVRVYDCRGALVRTIVSGRTPFGSDWTVSWDGTNDAGNRAPSGVYFLVAKSVEFEKVSKIVLIR